MHKLAEFKSYLDTSVSKFETPEFIELDPISIPHGFDDPRDQEIIGLYAALLSWGQRKTIINKLHQLCSLMSYKPYYFVYHFDELSQSKHLGNFVHRTFQPEDAIALTKNLSAILKKHISLEQAFVQNLNNSAFDMKNAIEEFSNLLFTIHSDTPYRLRKHLARPSSGSACKRFCMYLRWMIRNGPVDLGIWKSISPSHLVLPLDVHSGRQARALGMLSRKQNDWKGALELTQNCKKLSPDDPTKYDYAFFGLGVFEEKLDTKFTGPNKIDFSRL